MTEESVSESDDIVRKHKLPWRSGGEGIVPMQTKCVCACVYVHVCVCGCLCVHVYVIFYHEMTLSV